MATVCSPLLLLVGSLVIMVTRSCDDVCSATVSDGESTYYKIDCVDEKKAIAYFSDANCESSTGSYSTDEDCLNCSAYITYDATVYEEDSQCEGSVQGAQLNFIVASGSADDNGCFTDSYGNTIAYKCSADGTSFISAPHGDQSDEQCSGWSWGTIFQADTCAGHVIYSNIRCVGIPEAQSDDIGFTYSYYNSEQCEEDLSESNRWLPPAVVAEQQIQGCIALDDGSDMYVYVRCDQGTSFTVKIYDNAKCEGAPYENLIDFTETCLNFEENSALVSDITCAGTTPVSVAARYAPWSATGVVASMFLMMWV